MGRNRGQTSLKCRPRAGDPMRDFDSLPKELRLWIAEADLPWRPKSVRRSFERAMTRTGDKQKALEELGALQRRLVAQDVAKVWGRSHPDATPPSR